MGHYIYPIWRTYTHAHAHPRTRARAHTHTHTHTNTHTYGHTNGHTNIGTRTHIRTHTHTHARTHAGELGVRKKTNTRQYATYEAFTDYLLEKPNVIVLFHMLSRLQMILHLYIARGGYRFGTRTPRSTPEDSRLLWPSHRVRRRTVDTRISLPANEEARKISSRIWAGF